MKLYLAGPMRGYPEFNFPAFHEAALRLRTAGYEVWSPAENDLEAGFDPANGEALPLAHYMAVDLPKVCESDAVVVLDGWEQSEGAKLEVLVAHRCGIPVYRYPKDIDSSPFRKSLHGDSAWPNWGGDENHPPDIVTEQEIHDSCGFGPVTLQTGDSVTFSMPMSEEAIREGRVVYGSPTQVKRAPVYDQEQEEPELFVTPSEGYPGHDLIRKFETGATRDTDEGKYDYEGFFSPLVLERRAAYMHKHRFQSNGELRASDNWQKGIPLSAYASSLLRHVVDVWKLNRGFQVLDDNGEPMDIEEALCAVMFNAEGYLFELLRSAE